MELQDIKAKLTMLIGEQKFMKIPAAARYLNVGDEWLRERCREGVPGTVLINPESSKNQHFLVDVIEFGKYIKENGIVHQGRRKPRKRA